MRFLLFPLASQDPNADYIAELSTVIADGQQEQQVRLPIASTAYIAPGSVFSITISEVSLQDLEGVYNLHAWCTS